MEILNAIAEYILASFFIGAIVGGAIIAHLQLKPRGD